MRIVMLYRPNSFKAGMAEDYAGEYVRLHPERKIQMVSLDTREGDEMARLYSITNNPAVITIAENGSLLQLWQSDTLPAFDELDFYAVGA